MVIAGAESKINFDSIQKLVFSSMGIALLSYCAVSPRSLPFPEYNRLFLQNLFTVGLGAFPQLITLLCVYDGKYNNINTVVSRLMILFVNQMSCLLNIRFLPDWNFPCILHIRVHPCIHFRDNSDDATAIRCFPSLGACNLFLNARSSYHYFALGVERKTL